MSTNDPYLSARQARGERYGVCLYRANNWRVVAIRAPGLAGISVASTDCRLTGLIDQFNRKGRA